MKGFSDFLHSIVQQGIEDGIGRMTDALVSDQFVDSRGESIVNGCTYELGQQGMKITVQYFRDQSGEPILLALSQGGASSIYTREEASGWEMLLVTDRLPQSGRVASLMSGFQERQQEFLRTGVRKMLKVSVRVFRGNAESDETVRWMVRNSPFASSRTSLVTIRRNSRVAFICVNFMFQHGDSGSLMGHADEIIGFYIPKMLQRCRDASVKRLVNGTMNQVIYVFGE